LRDQGCQKIRKNSKCIMMHQFISSILYGHIYIVPKRFLGNFYFLKETP